MSGMDKGMEKKDSWSVGIKMKKPQSFSLKLPPPPSAPNTSTIEEISSADDDDGSLIIGAKHSSATYTQDTINSKLESEEGVFQKQTKAARLNCGVAVTGYDISVRYLHSAVNYEDFMFIFAGSNNQTALSDLGCFHFATRTWSVVENNEDIKPRNDHSAVVIDTSMLVFGGNIGGNGGQPTDQLLEFQFGSQSWSITITEGNIPSPRSGHTTVVHGDCMYLFGGKDADNKPLNDLYEYSHASKTWVRITPIGSVVPTPRYHHSAVVYKDSMYLFGGTDGSNKLGDFYEYKIRSKLWSQIVVSPSPSARDGHAVVVQQNSMYLIGGSAIGELDVYEFDFEFRKWYKIKTFGDTASSKQYCMATVRGDCIFLFGGISAENTNRLDYLSLGNDDFKQELEMDEMTKLQSQPKTQWEAIVMKMHPELLELHERIRPLSDAPTFARLLASSKTEAKTAISNEMVLHLIMEHLDQEGHKKVVDMIQTESSLKYQKQNFPESRLMTLLRVAGRRVRTENLWNPKPVTNYSQGDDEVEVGRRMVTQESEGQDVNIWEERDDKNVIKVVDEQSGKTVIQAASLNKLVQILTSEEKDTQFMKTFLYTYQSFTTPETLLKKLLQRYNVPEHPDMPYEQFRTEIQQPIRSRVCQVIKYWLDKCGWDFTDKLLTHLNAFIDGPLSRDGNLGMVIQLRGCIAKLHKKHQNTGEEGEVQVFGSMNPPEPKVPKNIFSPMLSLNDIDELEIARQLTLIEFHIFQMIAPPELLGNVWSDPDQKHKAPRITEMLQRYNDVVNWIDSTVSSSSLNIKSRARLVEKYIKIAEALKQLKNFQTLFAVLTGLKESTTNETELMAEVNPKLKEVYTELISLTSKESNYKTYKEFLRFSALPCIPYLDVILMDLLLLEEEHADTLNGLVNFEKRQLICKAITTLQGYQTFPYNLQPVYQITRLLYFGHKN